MTSRVARWMGSHRVPLEAFGVGMMTCILLALRAPFAIRRLWAEDGNLFLQQALDQGLLRPFGEAYAGYYLFVPRVIGAFAAAVPIREAPLATWLGVAAVVGWCAATIYVESEGWLATRPTRVLLALSVVLLPALGLEAIANSATLQYTLLFASLVALTGRSPTRWSSINRMTMVTVTALTTPLALMLAPIAALRVLRRRPRRVDATSAAWAIATSLQLGMILVARPGRAIGAPANRAWILSNYDHEVLYKNLLPKPLASTTVAPITILAGACLVLFAVWLAWRRARRETALLLLLVPALGVGFWTFTALNSGLPPRYRVFPALCVIWSALIASEEVLRGRRPQRLVDWRLTSIVVVVFALSWATYWRPGSNRSSGPPWSVALSEADRRCRSQLLRTVAVRISPATRRSRVWTVHVRCDEVLHR